MSDIELALSFLILVLGAALFYLEKVKPRFPRVTPIKFAAVAFVGFVSLVIGLVWVLSTDVVNCPTIELMISQPEGVNPLSKKQMSEPELDAHLRKYCAEHAEACGSAGGRAASRVTEICAPYR